MGKINEIQFQSGTKKYEKDCHVRGSNLYIIPFTRGTTRDWRKEYADYLISKATGQDMPVTSPKNISESFWGVFYKPENMSYSEFCEKIDNGEIAMIGHSPIIPTGLDYTRVDNNGNLLVKTITSKLDNYTDCGNMLINGETGEILRSPKASVIINSLTDNSNYYTIEVYKTTLDKESGKQIVTGKEYNFLDNDGKLVCSENIALTENETIYPIKRNYYDKDDKKVINDWDIYPTAYITAIGRNVTFYESAMDLLKNNRYEKSIGLNTINDETPYIEDMYTRKNKLDAITEKYGIMYDNNKLTEKMYTKLMSKLNDEYDKFEEFERKFETDLDRTISNSLDKENIQ